MFNNDAHHSGGNESGTIIEEQLQAVQQELVQVESEIERLLARQTELQHLRERLQRQQAADARAPRKDWQGSFAWDPQVWALLRDVFQLQGFRLLQREVINATLQGRDVLCLLPSGGGKSLCYQLPALLGQAGLTLVVSPLLSLIQDQVLGLEALGVRAAALTSLTGKEAAAAVLQQVDDAAAGLRLLYCTPEKIVSSKRFFAKLEKVYKQGRLCRIAIDEAHCCSQWGNDFRPDYKKLGVLKQQFPDTPIIALTATATQAVCDDLRTILRIEGCEFFRSSINRPNLYYEVKSKPAGAEELVSDIAGWIQHNYAAGESGIVYVLTRKDAEALAEALRGAGVCCQAYHADMDAAWREQVHLQWSGGGLQVIVATIAFGMGINNPRVRFVIHHTISKSVENYYQESGRAGRDGLPAHCRLYYRFADYLRQAQVVCMESNWEACLRGMLQYAAAPSCRRAVLCRHFGEAPARCDAMCDCCRRQRALAERPAGKGAATSSAQVAAVVTGRTDVTESAKGALRTLQDWRGEEKRATLIQLLDKWRGGKNKDGGAAQGLSREGCEAVVQGLVLEGALRLDFGFTAYATNAYLKLGPRAALFLQGKEQLSIAVPAVAATGQGPDDAVKAPWGHVAGSAQDGHDQQEGQQQRQQQRRQQQHQQQQQQGQPAVTGQQAALAPASIQEQSALVSGGDVNSALEAARQQLAAALDTIPAAILSDDQLRQLAAQRPTTQKQLTALIGREKTKLYGQQLLAALRRTTPASSMQRQQRNGSVHQQALQLQPAHKQQQQPVMVGRQVVQPQPAEVVLLSSSDEEDGQDGEFVAAQRGPKRGRKA